MQPSPPSVARALPGVPGGGALEPHPCPYPEQEDCLEFLEEERLKGLIKRYSEFINFPIYLYTTKVRLRASVSVRVRARVRVRVRVSLPIYLYITKVSAPLFPPNDPPGNAASLAVPPQPARNRRLPVRGTCVHHCHGH